MVIYLLFRDTLNEELEDVFTQMKSETIIERLSSNIQQTIIVPLKIDDDALALIDAWKDFISSWTMVL